MIYRDTILVFGTCSYDQIVDVPTLQIQDEILEVFQSTPQECISERIVARIVDFPLPQIQRQMVKVVKIIPPERVLERFVEQIVDQAGPQTCECRPCTAVEHRPAESVLLKFHGVLSSTVIELVLRPPVKTGDFLVFETIVADSGIFWILRDEKVQKLPARLTSSELRAHQMSPSGVTPHWRSRPALGLMDGI